MLNIIECVQPSIQHFARTVDKKKQRPKEADNCSQSLICCRKRYSSLSAKVFKGEIEEAMHKIQEKQREHFKTKTLDWRAYSNDEGQFQARGDRKDRKGSLAVVAVGGCRKVAPFNSLRSKHLRGMRKEIIFKGKDHSGLQQTGDYNNINKHAQT